MKKIILLVLLLPVFTFQITNGANFGRLFVGLTCDKSIYNSNDTIGMALTVLNLNNKSLKVTFNSAKTYDFYLYKGEQALWKWSADKMFTMAISNLTLEPKKPQTYVVLCNVKLPSGEYLEPGRYKLIGAFCTKEKEYLSEPAEIEIR
ncbi:MAG: BsuPI-related putative proteinase inhibitor [Bacillota bacterium]